MRERRVTATTGIGPLITLLLERGAEMGYEFSMVDSDEERVQKCMRNVRTEG